MECPFLGIDLTSSQSKPSAAIGLDENLDFIFAALLNSNAEIAAVIKAHQPYIVAIDAPLSLPQGLCCLEESCRCHPLEAKNGRNCERQLARLGIPCFFTTKKSIIKKMAYRGIELKAELEGHKVIEVYPYATKLRLWGKPIPTKSTPSGLIFLHERLASLLPSLASYVARFDHNLCDAVVAAYTAYLHYWGKTELIGDLGEGIIHIPKVAVSNWPCGVI
jgi:predicted nuclease with RNAse H fold